MDSPRHVSAGASVPRDPPARPSIPEPTPCACSSADAAEAKYRGSGCSRRVAQAPGRPEVCPEGQAAGGVCPAASRQGWLEGRCRCAVQELPSCWWSMPSCWWVCPSVYSACELCVCSVTDFLEAPDTFYTVHGRCRLIALGGVVHAFQKRIRSAPTTSEMGLLVGFKLRLARSNCFA